MIYVDGWEKYYSELADQAASAIDLNKVRDVSIGTFRIAAEYLKIMRRRMPDSEVCWFPFENTDGYLCYPPEIDSKMRDLMADKISQHIPSEKIWSSGPIKS